MILSTEQGAQRLTQFWQQHAIGQEFNSSQLHPQVKPVKQNPTKTLPGISNVTATMPMPLQHSHSAWCASASGTDMQQLVQAAE
jgi:hypothetical protein